jgi:hypothetical protein
MSEQVIERRQFKRHNLVYYIEVFDQETQVCMGRVADLTSQGMSLLTDNPIVPGTRCKMKFNSPADLGRADEIVVEATSRWCSPDVNPDYHCCGFQFTYLSAYAVALIDRVVFDYSFSD